MKVLTLPDLERVTITMAPIINVEDATYFASTTTSMPSKLFFSIVDATISRNNMLDMESFLFDPNVCIYLSA